MREIRCPGSDESHRDPSVEIYHPVANATGAGDGPINDQRYIEFVARGGGGSGISLDSFGKMD